MEEYLNYWLKKTIKDTPNDMELGEKIRKMMWDEKVNPTNEEDKRIFERNPDTNKVSKRKI